MYTIKCIIIIIIIYYLHKICFGFFIQGLHKMDPNIAQ